MEEARARGDTALDPEQLEKLRHRYDEATAFGITHNRLRDWHDGNHPGYALGCWPQEYKEQVWLFTREFAVEWTSNSAERAVKGPKRHQAVSGYWHTHRTGLTPDHAPPVNEHTAMAGSGVLGVTVFGRRHTRR